MTGSCEHKGGDLGDSFPDTVWQGDVVINPHEK